MSCWSVVNGTNKISFIGLLVMIMECQFDWRLDIPRPLVTHWKNWLWGISRWIGLFGFISTLNLLGSAKDIDATRQCEDNNQTEPTLHTCTQSAG